MTTLWIVISAMILLAGLLFFEHRKITWGVLLTKTPLSALFILTALVQPHPVAWYFYLMLAGLAFCLGGDVLGYLGAAPPFFYVWFVRGLWMLDRGLQ